MSFLQLGIDYGTSASKVVVRDLLAPGGGRAYPLRWDNPQDIYRLPSTVAVHDGYAWFGFAPGHQTRADAPPANAQWCGSLKMRVAAQVAGAPDRVHAYARSLPHFVLPEGWGYRDLLLLALTWTMRRSMARSLALTGRTAGKTRFAVTSGLPTDFRHDKVLANYFLAMFRAAHHLAEDRHVWGNSSADALVRMRLNAPMLKILASTFDDMLRTNDPDEMHYWHQSEARASTLWAWNSHEFTEGAYFHVDIGAGTTNVAAYLVKGRLERNHQFVRNQLSVISSHSGTVGVDAFGGLDRVASTLRTNATLREGLLAPYRQAFKDARTDTLGRDRPWQQWKGARIVALGGGSLSEPMVSAFEFDPYSRPGAAITSIGRTNPPPDLELGLGTLQVRERHRREAEARRTLAIAYGLSFTDGLPKEVAPKDIQPIEATTMRETQEGLGGIYEK